MKKDRNLLNKYIFIGHRLSGRYIPAHKDSEIEKLKVQIEGETFTMNF